MPFLVMVIGGLIPTGLISRLLLWIMRSWEGGTARLVTANVLSWLVVSVIAGFGMADRGDFAGFEAAFLYALPQIVWLVIDMVRQRRKSATAFPEGPASD